MLSKGHSVGFFASLRGKIIMLSLSLMVGGLLCLTVVSYSVAKARALELLNQQSQALLHAHADFIAGWIKTQSRAVESVVSAGKLENPAPFLRQAKAGSGSETVYFGYPDKKMADDTADGLTYSDDYDPTSRPWYQVAVNAKGPVFTEPYEDSGTHKLVITFSSPLREGDQLKGVAGLDVKMEDAVKNIESIRPTPQAFGFIISNAGKILIHRDAALILKNLSETTPDLTLEGLRDQAAKAELRFATLNGQSHLVGALPTSLA